MPAPTWGELIQSEEFQSLDDTGKEIFRDNYFQQAVIPEIPEGTDLEIVRANFDEQTQYTDIEMRQEKYEKETGVGERLGMRLKGGYMDVQAAGAASAIAGLQGDIEKLSDKEQIITDFEAGKGLPEDSFAQQLYEESPDRFTKWLEEGKADIPKQKAFLEKRKSQSFQRMRRLSKEAGAIPRAPVSEAVMKAKNWDEAMDLASIDPVSFIAEVGVRSLPMMALPIVKGVVGAAIFGPVGFAAGMGAGSFTVERAASLNGAMIEKLQEQGVDINNETAVMKAISEPDFFEEMKQDANTRGLVIGFFDALSGGLATKTLAPAAMKKGITKELLNVAAQMPLQAGAGGAGEAAAQAAIGEELKVGEILAEMAGELVQTPGDIAVATLAGVRERTKSDVNNVVNGDEKLKQRRADLDAKAEEYRQAEESSVDELELEARKEEIMEDASKFMEDVDSAFAKYEEEGRVIKALETDIGQEKIQAAQKAKEAAVVERDVDEYEGRPAMAPPKKVADIKKAVGIASDIETKKTEAITRKTETQLQKALREAAAQVDTSPTEAQKESGNYKKGHVSIQGLPVAIENPKGSKRSGVDEGGQKWTQKMQSHYGYIKKSEGADGDQVDVFLGDNAASADKVFIINQNNPYTGQFDEHKVLIGPATIEEANKEYLSNYAKGWAGLESTVEMTMPEFKQWLKGDTTKPVQQADVAKITPKITPAMAPPSEERAARVRAMKKVGRIEIEKRRDAVAEPKLSKKAKRKPKEKQPDFIRYQRRATEVVTWESVPSVQSGILPGIHHATEARKAEYNDAIYDLLVDAKGKDIILKKLGAELARTDQSMGSFELAISPNFITKIVAGEKDGVYEREAVDLYANIVGIIMTQDAVPWHRADSTLTGKKGASFGLEITASIPFTEKMARQFYDHVNTIMPGAEFSLINGRLRFINFRGEDGKPFLISDKKFRVNMSTIVDTFAGFDILEEIGEFGAEGEYYVNDWETNQEGQEFSDKIIAAGRSDILDWVRGRRNAVQKINQDFAKRYGWDQNPEPSVAAPIPLSRLTDPESAQQEIYGRFGTLTRDTDTTEDLKIYNLDDLIADPIKIDSLLTEYQYEAKYFSFHEDPAAGVEFITPKLKKEHYGTGVLWIYDPRVAPGSFKDEEYTRQWRIVHELAHGITGQIMQDRYGDSRREGRMGRSWEATRGHPAKRQVTVELDPLTLLEAQRAVEWEDVSFRVQRMLMEDMGIAVDPADFGREYNTNIGDALHRVLTGDFGDPGEIGFVPNESLPSIKSILRMLEKTENAMAKDQGRGPTKGVNLTDREYSFTETEEVSRGELKALQQMQEAARQGWAEVLPEMSRGIHESLATEAPGYDPRTATESQLSKLRKRIQKAGETPAGVVQALRESRLADASRRLQQAARGDLGVSLLPSQTLPWERITQDELRAEMAKQRKAPVLRKGAAGKVTVQQLTEHVSQLTNRWKNAPQIHAVENYTKLPAALKHYVETQRAEKEVDGLYDPGTNTVYLVADGISNTDHATKVIFHEVLGHAGIRATFGNDAVPLLRSVFKAKREEMAKVALDYGLDLTKPADQLVAAEEWLAMKAETSPQDSWVRRLISFIKTQLRRLFDLKITDTEILGALGRMRSTIENGEGLWSQAVAMFPMLSRSQEPFYSQMESVLTDKLPGKGTGTAYADTVKAFVKKGMIKSEEVEWSGLIEWLSDQKAKITKADVLDYVKANKIEVQEVLKENIDPESYMRSMFEVFEDDSGDGGFYARDLSGRIEGEAGEVITHTHSGVPVKYGDTEEEAWDALGSDYLDEDDMPEGTKYHDYQTPGGENYRELLLKLPAERGILDRWRVLRPDGLSDGLWASAEEAQARADKIGGTVEGKLTEGQIIDKGYRSSHFSELNILAHIRMNERVDVDGKRVLFLEEVQSDWHQSGRKKGYDVGRNEELILAAKKELSKAEQAYDIWTRSLSQKEILDINLSKLQETPQAERVRAAKKEVVRLSQRDVVPDAPFKTTWPLLAMKRMIRYAVENNFERIAWTTGEQQAERYDLSKKISRIEYSPRINALSAYDLNGELVLNKDVEQSEIADYIGKDAAEKLLKTEQQESGVGRKFHMIEGGDLKVGGEGMIGFYDQILPKTVNKYVKKWGAKVGESNIQTEEGFDVVLPNGKVVDTKDTFLLASASADNFEGATVAPFSPEPVHSIDVTDKMREAAMNGQPMFSRGSDRNAQNRPESSDEAVNDLANENNKTYTEWAKGVIDNFDRKIDGFGQLEDIESYRESRGKLQALIQQGQDTARHLYEAFNKVSEEEALNVFEFLTDRDVEASIIMDAKVREDAINAKNLINSMGFMMVERGIIPSASYQNFESRYLPRVYLSYLLGDKAIKALGTGKKLSKQGYARKRSETLTKEYREVVLGEIKDPAFLVSRAVGIPSRDLAIMEFFDNILKNPKWVLQDQLVEINIPGTNVYREVTPYWLQNEAKRLRAMSSQLGESDQKTKIDNLASQYEKLAADVMKDEQFDAEEYQRLPDTPQYGILRGMVVKRAIYDDIAGTGESLQDNPDAWLKMFGQGGAGTKITQMWKVMKVSLNPPSQVRNLVSNWVLLNLSGIPIHKMIPLLARAIGEIRRGGDYYKIAQEYGITAGTFSANELAHIEREFLDLQHRMKGGRISIPGLLEVASTIIEKAGDIYQHAEVLSKVAKIIHEIEVKGNTPALAAQEANKWLFDYSAVSKFIRTARNAPIGIPFLTFYMKVLPRLLEVAATAPWRFAPYYLMLKGMGLLAASMNDVDDDDIEALKTALPKWLQERGHAVIWPTKDDQGRWAATNLGYFFPWTAWTDVAQDIGEVGKGMVTGEPFEARNILQGAGVFGSPLSNLITASMTNIDPFTRKEIVRDGDLPYQQMLSRLNYGYSLMAPPWMTPGGPLAKIARAGSGYKDRWGNPQPTLAQSMARVVGVNIYPIDPVRSRSVNLRFMMRDLEDIKDRMKYDMRDPNLNKDAKRELRLQYKDRLRWKMDQIKRYKVQSKVHLHLR